MIEEAFEKGTQMMMKNWEAWQRMFATQQWWPKDLRTSATSQAELCLSSWKSMYEFNNRARKIMREQMDATYSKMAREMQLYSQAQENQVKDLWKQWCESEEAREREGQETFQRLENLIKPNDGSEEQ